MTFTVAPEITVSDQLHGVGLGANVTIKCKVEAHPSAINYWMKDQVCSKESGMCKKNPNKNFSRKEKIVKYFAQNCY